VIEGNGGRRHAAPTPNELGKGQEEEKIGTASSSIMTRMQELNKSILLTLSVDVVKCN
jgi:hypothetical protein